MYKDNTVLAQSEALPWTAAQDSRAAKSSCSPAQSHRTWCASLPANCT